MQTHLQPNEEWRFIPSYEGIYEVSNTGKIRTHNRLDIREMKQQTRSGVEHRWVWLARKMTRKKKYVHVAVLEAFVSLRPKGMEARHLDGNPANNHVSNLKWGTHKENMQDSIKHGTFNHISRPGENHINAILKDKDVLKIKEYFKTTKMTNGEIGKLYGVGHSTISKIRTEKNWAHIKV